MAAASRPKSADRKHNGADLDMKTPTRILLTLVLVSAIGGLCMTPSFAKDSDDRRGHEDKGWHKGQSKNGYYEDRREWRPAYQPIYREPYYYSRPVYVPPPVYYPPPQSPGISLFFPLDLR
jgi:hypothetical protein